jgi:hypothetical protein
MKKSKTPKKRNPVAKSAPRTTSSAGIHKDKKASVKRGDPPKHKKTEYMEGLQKELAKILKENLDYEGGMARSQLIILATRAIRLATALKDHQQLDAWVQTKIAVAEDNIDSVYSFLTTNRQDVDGKNIFSKN